MNGYELNMSEEVAYNMVIQVAQGKISKEELTSVLEPSVLEQHIQLQ